MLEVPSSRALNPSQFESEPSPAATLGVGVLCTPGAELLLTSFFLELPCLSEVGLLPQAQREVFLQLTQSKLGQSLLFSRPAGQGSFLGCAERQLRGWLGRGGGE